MPAVFFPGMVEWMLFILLVMVSLFCCALVFASIGLSRLIPLPGVAKEKRPTLRRGAAFVMIAGGLVFTARSCHLFNDPPYIHEGATKAEVVNALGEPDVVQRAENGTEQWGYWHDWVGLSYEEYWFDEFGKVSYHWVD